VASPLSLRTGTAKASLLSSHMAIVRLRSETSRKRFSSTPGGKWLEIRNGFQSHVNSGFRLSAALDAFETPTIVLVAFGTIALRIDPFWMLSKQVAMKCSCSCNSQLELIDLRFERPCQVSVRQYAFVLISTAAPFSNVSFGVVTYGKMRTLAAPTPQSVEKIS
jgi:hypothetical protein